MSESVDRYFRSLPVGRKSRPSERTWCPAADVLAVADGWIVKLELVGVAPDEVEIVVDESVSYYQLEITYSRFHKKLSFPCTLKDVAVERIYQNGLLVLHLRKQDEGCAL